MVHKGVNPNSEKITQKTARAIIEYVLEHPTIKKQQLTAIKGRVGKQFGFVNVIKDSVIASYATKDELDKISFLLRRRLTRTLSGVTIVAVMTAPTPAGSKSWIASKTKVHFREASRIDPGREVDAAQIPICNGQADGVEPGFRFALGSRSR